MHRSEPSADKWFNAIRGIFDFAERRNLIKPGAIGQGSWFSSIDAVILEGIHDGLALSREKRGGRYKDNPGAPLWRNFFEARRSGASQGRSTALWGDAEQVTTDFARQRVGPGNAREEAFINLSDGWRWALRQDDKKKQGFLFLGGVTPWLHYDAYGNFDPKTRTRVSLGADAAWGLAGAMAYDGDGNALEWTGP